ncbi:MAG: hypothetical protein IPM29_25680 [Planctomycetes bacterium]|nr:hypothetical protein [Planctomycetota bacterium]
MTVTDSEPHPNDAPAAPVGGPAGGCRARVECVDLVLVGGRLGEAELLARAARDQRLAAHVVEAPSVAAALDALRAAGAAAHAVIVWIDANGDCDTMSALAALRADPLGAAVPLLVVGGMASDAEIRALRRAGANSVIERSNFLDVHLRTLRGAVAYWLGADAALPPAAD